CAEVRPAACLGERSARVEQSRADDRALCQEAGYRVVSAASLPDRREPVHEGVFQIARSAHRDLCGGIGDVLRAQGQSRDVAVGVDEARHERTAAAVDDDRAATIERSGRQRVDETPSHQDVGGSRALRATIQNETRVGEERVGHCRETPRIPPHRTGKLQSAPILATLPGAVLWPVVRLTPTQTPSIYQFLLQFLISPYS